MESKLPEEFRNALQQLGVDKTQRFIIAVSGGMDSVVLCELCYRLQLQFLIVHCNFNLRGAESNRDEAFVKSLGDKYGVDVLVEQFDTAVIAAAQQLSIQEAARNLRYQWFEKVRKEKKAAFVLLAHHANDNIETLLMHFFRGTGLQGLKGMPQQSQYLARCLRPLLNFSRKEIEAFAREGGLQWVEDSSNQLTKYTRNFFRNTLIPQLQTVYPQVEENLLQNINRLGQTFLLYQQLVQKEKETILIKKGIEYRVVVKRLMAYSQTSMLYEIIKDFNFNEKAVGELTKLAVSTSGKYMESPTHRIIKHRAWFIITPLQQKGLETFILDKETNKIYLPNGVLELQKKNLQKTNIKSSSTIAHLDARQLQFPLLVRRWKEGDYFFPLGMPKKKKLARFFIDQKLSLTEKEKIWVVESANRIVWIVNHRIDERFKLTPHTKDVLQLTYWPI